MTLQPVPLAPLRLLAALGACTLGGAAMVAGEVDDAPGLVLLGLLAVLVPTALLVPGAGALLAGAVGVVGVVSGLSDGEPGVVVLGVVLVAVGVLLGLRGPLRRSA